MSKTGYLIARNKKVDAFFTASSAYDRPNWKPVNEATVYATAEMAQNAIKKLLRYGAYEARLIPLAEAIELSMPDEELPPPEGDMPPMDGEELPPMDGELDPDADPEADMVAADQDEPCETCEHCPCTCDPDEDGVDDIVDAQLAGEDLPPMDGEELPPMDGEELPPMDGEELPPRSPFRESYELSDKPQTIKFKDPAATDPAGAKSEPSAGDHEEKCACPAELLSDLQKVIDEMTKCAEMANTRDDTRASFCMTVAEAMKTLKDKLSLGTIAGIKAAQVEMTSWMNPITVHVPVSVQKFIFMGGRKPTLKDMFNTKWDQKRGE